ncbi:MAG: hypothetical protein HAW63_03855 [Bdellovibrionaceae bacterium]|nr:hypothetical protein [Pseudobdellovibrionaceae bacterium]
MASIFLYAMGIYFSLGVVFSIFFLLKAIHKMDALVKVSSPMFRLFLLPASILLWPYLLYIINKRKL